MFKINKNNHKKNKSKSKKSIEEILLYYEKEFSILKEDLKKILDSYNKNSNIIDGIDEKTYIDNTMNEYFKKIRAFFIDVLKLKKGFTYEEVYKNISRRHISESLKNDFKKLVLELNDLEYSPNKNYEKLQFILDELLSLSKKMFLYEEEKHKNVKEKSEFLEFLQKIFLFLKKVTFIFWFPFYFLFLKLKSLFVREETGVFKVKKLLEEGNKLLEKKNLYEAVKLYDVIRKEYYYLEEDDKLLLKGKIVEFYNKILELYKELEELEEKNKKE